MKEFIAKNKKIISLVLIAVTVLFLVLLILNLTGMERKSYQTLYDSYAVMGNMFGDYGKIGKYKLKLMSLNIAAGIYGILAVASSVSAIVIYRMKLGKPIGEAESIESDS